MTLQDIDIGELLEVVFSTFLLAGYVYLAAVEGQRFDDPLLEALLFLAVLTVYGDAARDFLRPGDESRRID